MASCHKGMLEADFASEADYRVAREARSMPHILYRLEVASTHLCMYCTQIPLVALLATVSVILDLPALQKADY